ncbi:MAG: carboxylating nicotinate-nucleotide diphosphorylase [Balneolaceae bacterium]
MSEIASELKKVLQIALDEDRGFGDLTSKSIFSDETADGRFIAKESGILCGSGAIPAGYGLIDPEISIKLFIEDGEPIQPGDVIAAASGAVRHLLTGERIILNLMQHLSGISTETQKTVSRLDDPEIKICDTRKTLPGLRLLQKYAVRTGGGYNHRFRLDDGVMIKDNHIAAAGGIKNAVQKIRNQVGPLVKIEVETENESEVREAVEAKADVIMLDNRTPDQVKSLRSLIPESILVEVSGGINRGNIAPYKNCGADFISLGALTHSVKALDISFDLAGNKGK